ARGRIAALRAGAHRAAHRQGLPARSAAAAVHARRSHARDRPRGPARHTGAGRQPYLERHVQRDVHQRGRRLQPLEGLRDHPLALTNRSCRPRKLDRTSYAETALAPHSTDRAHPAFNKLFVQTEAVPEQNALLAWRRPRSANDPEVWAAHVLAVPTPFERKQL